MAEQSRISRSTIIVILGIAATAGWLSFTLWDTWSTGHISSGQICLVHVGQADRSMPTVCVMSEAREPTQVNALQVILSREHLVDFSKTIDQHARDQPERNAFGTYEIRDSIHPRRNEHLLRRDSVRAVLQRLSALTESPSKAKEMEQLAEVMKALDAKGAAAAAAKSQ